MVQDSVNAPCKMILRIVSQIETLKEKRKKGAVVVNCPGRLTLTEDICSLLTPY